MNLCWFTHKIFRAIPTSPLIKFEPMWEHSRRISGNFTASEWVCWWLNKTLLLGAELSSLLASCILPQNVLEILVLVWTRLTKTNSCCISHMGKVNLRPKFLGYYLEFMSKNDFKDNNVVWLYTAPPALLIKTIPLSCFLIQKWVRTKSCFTGHGNRTTLLFFNPFPHLPLICQCL